MKTYLKLAALLVVLVGFMTSCDNDDKFRPDQDLQSFFKTMHPNAKYVEWEMERGYYSVEFSENGFEKETWYDKDKNWVLTETDYDRNIPDIILQSLSSTEYKDWRIDDVDFIEMRDKDSFFVVEVEKGNQEKDLYFSESGELLDVKSGEGDYHSVPW